MRPVLTDKRTLSCEAVTLEKMWGVVVDYQMNTSSELRSCSFAKKLTAIHEYITRSTEGKGGGPETSHYYGCFKNSVLNFVVYNAGKRREGGRTAGKPS